MKKLLRLVCLLSLASLAIIPLASQMMADRANSELFEAVQLETTEKDWSQELEAIQAWNEKISSPDGFLKEAEDGQYEQLLAESGGLIGWIQIPSINVSLPIYHGEEETTLQSGIGHNRYSALPIGGQGTRAILSGHRGIPGSALFTRLDELEAGDLFELDVAGQKLIYEVFESDVILPEETQNLLPVQGQDLVTLVTCTPYGINSHRLVITASRRTDITEMPVPAPQFRLSWPVLALTSIPWFLLAWIAVHALRKRNRKQKDREFKRALKTLDYVW